MAQRCLAGRQVERINRGGSVLQSGTALGPGLHGDHRPDE